MRRSEVGIPSSTLYRPPFLLNNASELVNEEGTVMSKNIASFDLRATKANGSKILATLTNDFLLRVYAVYDTGEYQLIDNASTADVKSIRFREGEKLFVKSVNGSSTLDKMSAPLRPATSI